MPSSSSAINANNEVNGNISNDDQSKLDHENTFQDTPNQLQIEESQDKDVLDFQCHLNDFKENEMTEKVLIRLMKDWTQIYILAIAVRSTGICSILSSFLATCQLRQPSLRSFLMDFYI